MPVEKDVLGGALNFLSSHVQKIVGVDEMNESTILDNVSGAMALLSLVKIAIETTASLEQTTASLRKRTAEFKEYKQTHP